MKLQLTSILLCLSSPILVKSGCISEDPNFQGIQNIKCKFGEFKKQIKELISVKQNSGDNSCKSAPKEVRDLFGVSSNSEVREILSVICGEADAEKAGQLEASAGEFENILSTVDEDDQGRFLKEFFDGNTELNHVVKQHGPNQYHHNSERDDIHEFHKDYAKTGIVTFPDNIKNFDNCELNTVMCCWVTDRLNNNNNNGNCKTPYPTGDGPSGGCINKDPADNTDICYSDHSRSPQSNHVAGGFTIYDGEEEGDAHCHGFVWNEDDLYSNVYKGNNLFYVSMKDHWRDRGYVRSVPGSPMCGCLETMPSVSRADCTETSVDATYDFDYRRNQKTFEATVSDFEIRFDACDDGNGNENDLEAKFAQLNPDNTSLDAFSAFVVGDGNCDEGIQSFLGQMGIVKL